MARKIVTIIENCGECPYKDSRSMLGDAAYIPYCSRTNRNLPFIPQSGRVSLGVVFAVSTNKIPEWCPLEK